MITEIEIEGFKSLEKVHLKLGKFNLFIGANASGKSNFFDALRVLQGVGYGFTIDEIFNGKPKSASSEVWAGIRGGTSRAAFLRRGEAAAALIGFRAVIKRPSQSTFELGIKISPSDGRVRSEFLRYGGEEIFRHDIPVDSVVSTSGVDKMPDPLKHQFDSVGRRALHATLSRALGNMQRVEPSLAELRGYSRHGTVGRMGEGGEDFAALVHEILSEERLRPAYVDWLRGLTPVELDDVEILKGAVGEPLFAIREGDEIYPASILSDGTLRFAAIAAAFFQPDMPYIITIEEIENGIHPSRLRLLIELLKSQSHVEGPQVFATTHSPVVLAWLEESDYETTFFCKRDEETGASIIKPLSEIPRLVELVKKSSLGELFAEGWMEGAF